MRLPWLVVFCGSALLTCAELGWSAELVTAEEALASQAEVPMLAVDATSANPQGPVISVSTPRRWRSLSKIHSISRY